MWGEIGDVFIIWNTVRVIEQQYENSGLHRSRRLNLAPPARKKQVLSRWGCICCCARPSRPHTARRATRTAQRPLPPPCCRAAPTGVAPTESIEFPPFRPRRSRP